MTEQTVTQTPAAEAVVLPAYTVPEAGTVTEREFLAGIKDAKGQPLAVTQSKDGGPARGRFSTLAKAVLADAEANGFVAKESKPKAKPRVAKTTAPKTESVAGKVSLTKAPSPADLARPVPAEAPVTRTEGTAWGFMSRLGRGRKG